MQQRNQRFMKNLLKGIRHLKCWQQLAQEPLAQEPLAFEPLAFEPLALEPISFVELVEERVFFKFASNLVFSLEHTF
jgi:hypothetical protein